MAYNKLKAHEYYMKHRKLKGKKGKAGRTALAGSGPSSAPTTGLRSGPVRGTGIPGPARRLASDAPKKKSVGGSGITDTSKKKSVSGGGIADTSKKKSAGTTYAATKKLTGNIANALNKKRKKSKKR